MAKSMKLGGGGRFKALETKLEKQGKSAASAKAITASEGIKKYSQKKMTAMAEKGKERAEKHGGKKPSSFAK